MKHLTYLSGAIMLLLTLSCTKNKQSNVDWPLDTKPAFKDGDISIAFAEKTDSTGRHLIFDCKTVKIFGCVNYSLIDTMAIMHKAIEIKFLYVYQPTSCLTALGPAHTFITLANLETGNYDILIAASGTSIGTLSVDDEKYVLNFPALKGIILKQTTLQRIPDHVIYGYMIHTPLQNDKAMAFLDSLEHNGAEHINITSGVYSDFQVNPQGKVLDKEGDISEKTWFIYNYTGDYVPLQHILDHFDSQQISIGVYTPTGKIYYN